MKVDYEYKALVLSIVDGDTIKVDIDLGFSIRRKESVRLAGINAPELRGEEREAGLEAKAWLVERIPPGTTVLLQTEKEKGKYGRYIAWVLTVDADGGKHNVNLELVEAGHAEKRDY